MHNDGTHTHTHTLTVKVEYVRSQFGEVRRVQAVQVVQDLLCGAISCGTSARMGFSLSKLHFLFSEQRLR